MNKMNNDWDFYVSVLKELLSEGILSETSRVLVVCGGDHDYNVFLSLGFQDVTITNTDTRLRDEGTERFAPFAWHYQDAERLSYEDNSFDFVIVHSGLHHLRSPHKGITEMYRVASSGILGFEPYRNLFTTLGVALGFGQKYEIAAVFHNDCKYGGVENTAIPNFIYRFTSNVIRLTIQSCAPIAGHQYRFWYTMRIPERLFTMRKRYFGILVRMASPILTFLGRRFPFFANNMAFFVRKPSIPKDLFPWLQAEGTNIVPDVDFLEKIYGQSKRKT